MSILSRPLRLRTQILLLTAGRTLVNTAFRMVYPFVPVFARGIGVDVEAIALALTARYSLGFLGPLLGSLADVRGRRIAMLTGLSVILAGMLLVTGAPLYVTFFVMVLAVGAGKTFYDTGMQAYIGDRVAYTQRGLAIGITEMSWSLAFLLGIPLIGWLIERGGWAAPFPWLAGITLLLLWTLWRTLPRDAPARGERPSLRDGIRVILANRGALAALSISALISGGNELVNITFGVWMEDAYGLQIAALGGTAIVIGLAELSGEGLVVAITDRLGKRRAIGLGLLGSMLSPFALPLAGDSVVIALIALFLFYLTFEFTIVSSIALLTELSPQARATLMAANGAFHAMGRSVGALIGPALFAAGIGTTAVGVALFNGVALAALVLFVRE